MPYVLAPPSMPSDPAAPLHRASPAPSPRTSVPQLLHRSPSQTQLARPVPAPAPVAAPDLSFPSFESTSRLDAGAATASSASSSTAVPFPKIVPGRRKRVRGVGNQPWHHTGSSDSEDDSPSSGSSTSLTPPPSTTTTTAAPPPPAKCTVRPLNLRLDLSAVNRRTYSESQLGAGNGSSTTSSNACTPQGPLSASATTPTIYRSNGTPVKSSLKSSRSSSSVRLESGARQVPSVPHTPSMEKIVHFDAQLEQIKLFRVHHRPSAISREGSPQDSEEDSEFVGESRQQQQQQQPPLQMASQRRAGGVKASFYPGSSEEEKIRQTLVLEQVNIPLRNALLQPDELLAGGDVKLEKIGLSADAKLIEGAILVRNIAFEKWVSVRFTFDWWQTTSEVTARYRESLPEYNLDRFEYSLRVPDVTNKIEEKRLFVAIRYRAADREVWDNNHGENYQLRFKRVVSEKTKDATKKPSAHPPSWPVKSANVDQMADLRRKLEQVVQDDEDEHGTSAWDRLTAKLRARNMHIEEDRENHKQAALSLRKRYDFEASSKVKWQAPQELPKYNIAQAGVPFPTPTSISTPEQPQRSRSPPPGKLETSRFASAHRVAPAARGSPRDPELEHSPKFFIDPRDANPHHHHHHHARSHSHSPTTARTRHHQRGGYFDSWMEEAAAQGLRLTPCGNGSPAATATVATAPATTSTPPASSLKPTPSTPSPTPEEVLSETESLSSTASSSSTSVADMLDNSSSTTVSFSADRSAIRFNSYPMDRSQISSPATTPGGGAPTTTSATTSTAMGTTMLMPTHPSTMPSWIMSPSGSFSSTPSITSASTPSQCPSSPSESMLDASAEGRFGATAAAALGRGSTLDSLDYNYFLSRFCYFTGTDAPENRYGAATTTPSLSGHRQSQSDSNIYSHASAAPNVRRRSLQFTDEPWVGGDPNVTMHDNTGLELGELSGHTTPTQSPMPKFTGLTKTTTSTTTPEKAIGMVTPRVGSPLPEEVERTPRPSFEVPFHVRPFRGSF